MDSRKNIVFSICHFDAGNTYNVFPDSALIRGTIRCYDLEAKETMIKRINEIATDVAKAYDCEADVNIFDKYPSTINHDEQVDHVIRLAKEVLGPDNFS